MQWVQLPRSTLPSYESKVAAPITNESVHINMSCVSEKDGHSLSNAEITGISRGITFLMATH